MNTKLTSLFLGLLLLAGCATSDTDKTGVKSPAESGKVVFLFVKPEKTFVELGTVSALKRQPQLGDATQNSLQWQNALQQQASAMGADAVIVDTTTLNNQNTQFVTGKAIHYTGQ